MRADRLLPLDVVLRIDTAIASATLFTFYVFARSERRAVTATGRSIASALGGPQSKLRSTSRLRITCGEPTLERSDSRARSRDRPRGGAARPQL